MKQNLIFIIALVSGLHIHSQAQTPTQRTEKPGPMAIALSKEVHLSPDMTISQAMKSLSDQMGVPIQLADYLGERQLTTQIDHVTARNALDALAELEDWQWKEDTVGRIRIERRPTLVPKEAAYIPRWIQAELPRDFRDYFGLPRPDDDPKKYSWSVIDNQYNAVSLSLNKALRQQVELQKTVVENHLIRLQAGEKVYFPALSPQEKGSLLLALSMQAIFNTGPGFWRGDLPPYVVDPSTAILKVNGKDTLMIGTKIQIGDRTTGMYFGVPIKR